MSRLPNNPNQKKGGEQMYTLEETKRIIIANPYTCNYNKEEQDEILNSKDNTRKFIITSKLNTEDYPTQAIDYNITETHNKKGETMYKLNYQQHNILKQAAYIIMQNHNKTQYKNKTKQYIKYNQTLAILYKTKTTNQLLDIIDQFTEAQLKQRNTKLIQHNQKQIITNKLKDVTPQQLERIKTRIQQLEEKYILQLDTDYNSKQSILESWQQILYYKEYHIRLELKETEEEPYREEQSYDLDDLLEEYPDLPIWNPEERRD